MDMPNLQLLFDAQVNSKASLTLFTYKFGNFADKPFDDKPFMFWANHLLSTPLFQCIFVVAFDANIKAFKWSSSINSVEHFTDLRGELNCWWVAPKDNY